MKRSVWPLRNARFEREEQSRKLEEQNSNLQSKIKTLANKTRMTEIRLFEAIQEKRDIQMGGPPVTRGHWQAKPYRDQARFLYTNDAHTRRLLDSATCNMVGKGVIPIARSEKDEQAEQAVSKYLHRWMTTTDCDYDGNMNLPGIQALSVLSTMRDGAIFLRRIPHRRQLKIQMLEADYLDVSKNIYNTKTKNDIENGIEYDHRTNRITAYWMYQHHPEELYGPRGGSMRLNSMQKKGPFGPGYATQSIRIPAEEIIHTRRIHRAGAQDGISWLAPVMTKIWDLREYEEAKLKQQKLQACFTGIVKDSFTLDEEQQDRILGMVRNNIDGLKDMEGSEISPGHYEVLPPGKDVIFPTPSPSSDERFVERALRGIAAGVGVSYEVFNDYSQVSYSSGRMGFLEMDRNLKHIMRIVFEPQLLLPLGNWVLNHLVMNNILPEDHDVKITWTPPARELIDPAAESAALSSMIASNLISHREAHAILGQDFEKTVKDIQKSNEFLKAHGLSPVTLFGGSVANEEILNAKESGGAEAEGEGGEESSSEGE